MPVRVKTLGLAGLLVGVACGGTVSGGGGGGGSDAGGGSSTGNGSCTSSAGGAIVTCTDYGEGFTASTVMQVCTSSMATYSTSACPSTNRVGRCELTATNGGATAIDAVSFYPPETTANAMSACAMENGMGPITTTFTPN